MFGHTIRFLHGGYRLTRANYQAIHAGLMMLLAMLIIMITGMWGLNIAHFSWVNYFIAICMTYPVVVSLTSWRAMTAAGTVGGGHAFLADTDVSQGARDGILILLKLLSVVVVIAFVFGVWLGFVQYAPAPATFWPMALMVAVCGMVYGITANESLRDLAIAAMIGVVGWNAYDLYKAHQKVAAPQEQAVAQPGKAGVAGGTTAGAPDQTKKVGPFRFWLIEVEPGKVVEVGGDGRCVTTGPTDQEMRQMNIAAKLVVPRVHYTNNGDEPRTFKVWVFPKGGHPSCPAAQTAYSDQGLFE